MWVFLFFHMKKRIQDHKENIKMKEVLIQEQQRMFNDIQTKKIVQTAR